MSSSHPPRLQLNLPPPTQSFKRSFQEFGFDVDSPSGGNGSSTSLTDAGGSGPGNANERTERNKRARSETLSSSGGSGDSSGSSFVPSLQSSGIAGIGGGDVSADFSSVRSTTVSSLSTAVQAGFLEPLDSSRFSPRLPFSIPEVEDVRMMDSPRTLTPDLPTQAIEEEWEPTMAYPPLSASEEAFRGSLERIREFNAHISALRRSPDPQPTRPSVARPRLPSLASFEDITVDHLTRDNSPPEDTWTSDPSIWTTNIDRHRNSRNTIPEENNLPHPYFRVDFSGDIPPRRLNSLFDDGPSRWPMPSRASPRRPSPPVIPDISVSHYRPVRHQVSPHPLRYSPSPEAYSDVRSPPDFPRPFSSVEEERNSLIDHVNALLENFSDSPSLELSAGRERDREPLPSAASMLDIMMGGHIRSPPQRRDGEMSPPVVRRGPQLVPTRQVTRSPSPLPASVMEDSWLTRMRRLSDDIVLRRDPPRREATAPRHSRPFSFSAAGSGAQALYQSSLLSFYRRQSAPENNSGNADPRPADGPAFDNIYGPYRAPPSGVSIGSRALSPSHPLSPQYYDYWRESPTGNNTAPSETPPVSSNAFPQNIGPRHRGSADSTSSRPSNNNIWGPYSTFAPRRSDALPHRVNSHLRGHGSVPSASASLMAESAAERHQSTDRARLFPETTPVRDSERDEPTSYSDLRREIAFITGDDDVPPASVRPRLRTLRHPSGPRQFGHPNANPAPMTSNPAPQPSSLLRRLAPFNRTTLDASSSSEEAAFYASGTTSGPAAESSPASFRTRRIVLPAIRTSSPERSIAERNIIGSAYGYDRLRSQPADLPVLRSPTPEEDRPAQSDITALRDMPIYPSPPQPTATIGSGPTRPSRAGISSALRYPDPRLPPRPVRPWTIWSHGRSHNHEPPRSSQPPSLPPLAFQRDPISLTDENLERHDTDGPYELNDDMRPRSINLPGIRRLLPHDDTAYTADTSVRDRESLHEALSSRRWVHAEVAPRRQDEETEPLLARANGFQEAMNVLRSDGLSASRQSQFQTAYQAEQRMRERNRTQWGDIDGDDGQNALSTLSESMRRRRNAFSREQPEVPPRNAGFPGVRGLSVLRRSPSPSGNGGVPNGNRSGFSSTLAATRRLARHRARLRSSFFDENFFADPTWGDMPYHSTFRVRRSGRNPGDYVRDEDFDSSYESLLALAATLGEAKPRATPDHVICSLPTGFYKDWQTADCDTRCPICLDDYKALDPVLKISSCDHWFHKECLEQWLHSARTCPVCRRRVKATPQSSDRLCPEPGPSGTSHDNHPSDDSDSDDSPFSSLADYP